MVATARNRYRRIAAGSVIVLSACVLAAGSVSLRAKDPPPRQESAHRPASAARARVPEQTRVIDREIGAGWQENHLTPSKPATDHEFIRRASLDIIGRIATPSEIKRFLADPQATRRAQLIDRLLASDEYARNWAGIWTVWLMTRSGPREYHDQMRRWLEGKFAAGDSAFDAIVTELLTATGKNTENGSVNFILSQLGESIPNGKQAEEGQFTMIPLTSRTTRLFLGLQIQCTQCHDHPFNQQWKQQSFWGINAFFRQVEQKGAPPRRANAPMAVLELEDNPDWNADSAVFFENRSGVVRTTRATFLDGTKMTPRPGASRRQELVDFITQSEYFPKAYVNRMWAHFFGRGMNTPGAPDDFGEHNQLTHPKLLEYLSQELRGDKYNPRDLVRWICNSEAYGLSSVANRTNEKPEAEPYFSRMLLKAMNPEQLFESLMAATEAGAAESTSSRAALRDRWLKNLIVNFGDDEGNEVTFNGTVVQALVLMNSKEVNEAVSSKDRGPVARAFKHKGASARTVLDDIFLAVLNRPATPAEHADIPRRMRMRVSEKDPWAPWQDLEWALLNSSEFILNH